MDRVRLGLFVTKIKSKKTKSKSCSNFLSAREQLKEKRSSKCAQSRYFKLLIDSLNDSDSDGLERASQE